MKNRTFSKISMSLTALALLAVFGLAGCGSEGGDNNPGGGGGGSNIGDNPSANSTTAVINQSGGAITLADGTTVTFVAGLVKDGTNVTVSSTAQPTLVPTQEVQALSPTVVVDVPPDSLLATAPAGSTITIEIPFTGNVTKNSVAGLSTTTTKAGVISTVNDIVQILVTGGEVATYYAPLILKSSGKIAVSIGIDKLCKAAYGSLACKAAHAIVGAYNVSQCTQQTTSLYQVDFHKGVPDFVTNIQRNGKPPLILVHGWQEMAIIATIAEPIVGGFGCNKPYSSTWQSFLKEFPLDPAISDKFQVFSLAYNTSFPIFGAPGGTGSDFAQIIGGQFGQEAVYVVAHSMGGIVARSALVNHGANIGGLVTLATPHHGTPVASQEGVDLFGSTPLYPLIDYVIGGEGIMDLAWDNFDGLPYYHNRRRDSVGPILGNKPLEDLNANDTYRGRYVVFAGVDNEPIIGAIIQPLKGDNDAVVPERSALFYNSGYAPDSRMRLQKRFDGLSHFSITSDVGVLSETRTALLGFLNDITPPSVPAGLTATAASGSQISLTWSASTDDVGVTGYKIYRGGTYLKSASTTTSSDTGLSASTQYCYTVSAYDAAGNESIQSSSACATTGTTSQYTLTVSKSGTGSGTVSANGLSCGGTICTGSYNQGIPVTL